MKKADVIRAWRNPEYRESLSEDLRFQMPDHPAGLVALDDEDLRHSVGGTMYSSHGVCPATYQCP